jgi:hypothetical protein
VRTYGIHPSSGKRTKRRYLRSRFACSEIAPVVNRGCACTHASGNVQLRVLRHSGRKRSKDKKMQSEEQNPDTSENDPERRVQREYR